MVYYFLFHDAVIILHHKIRKVDQNRKAKVFPSELNIIDHEFDYKECHRQRMVVILNIQEDIIVEPLVDGAWQVFEVCDHPI